MQSTKYRIVPKQKKSELIEYKSNQKFLDMLSLYGESVSFDDLFSTFSVQTIALTLINEIYEYDYSDLLGSKQKLLASFK